MVQSHLCFKNDFIFLSYFILFFDVLRHWGMGMVDEFIVCSFYFKKKKKISNKL